MIQKFFDLKLLKIKKHLLKKAIENNLDFNYNFKFQNRIRIKTFISKIVAKIFSLFSNLKQNKIDFKNIIYLSTQIL